MYSPQRRWPCAWSSVKGRRHPGTVHLLCQELLHPQQPTAISVSQHPQGWQTWAELVAGWGLRLATYCAHLGPAPPPPPARDPWPMAGAQLLKTMPPAPGPAWSAPPMAPSSQMLTLPVPWQWLWIALVLVWSPRKLTVSSLMLPPLPPLGTISS